MLGGRIEPVRGDNLARRGLLAAAGRKPDGGREAEEEEWARIQNSRDRATFETFLRRFPGGAFTTEASRRRDQLAAAPQPQQPPPQPQP